MSYLLSIDPGKSTGITLWEYGDHVAARRILAWQFGHGLNGVLRWIRDNWESNEDFACWEFNRKYNSIGVLQDRGLVVYPDSMNVIAEKFVPLSGGGFSQTLDSVEPLRIEGALIALGIALDYTPGSEVWPRASGQYWMPGKDTKAKRKAQKEWLKEHGLYLIGKDVNAPDAEDAISSTFHAVQWFRKHHEITRREWFGED